MRSLTQLLRVTPSPGHNRAAEQARGLQTGFGAKAGAPAAVCGVGGTRAGLTFWAAGEGAPLHSVNRLTNVMVVPVGFFCAVLRRRGRRRVLRSSRKTESMIKTAVSLLGFALLLAGCQTAEKVDYTPTLARFFLEEADARTIGATLPQSGVRVMVGPKPVLTEGDIVNVELMQVELGKCLMFQLTPAAARDLYRVSGSNQGRRLVLFLNNLPVGARRMEGPLAEGAVLMFVEVPDAALPALVENLKETSAAVQRAAARK